MHLIKQDNMASRPARFQRSAWMGLLQWLARATTSGFAKTLDSDKVIEADSPGPL